MVMSKTRLLPLHDVSNERSIRVLVAGDQNLQDSVSEALDSDEVSLIENARTGPALMEKLSQGGFDCVVIDQTLGKQTSVALQGMIAAKYSNPPPMVMLTGESDARIAVEAFRSGISDYVTRDHKI